MLFRSLSKCNSCNVSRRRYARGLTTRNATPLRSGVATTLFPLSTFTFHLSLFTFHCPTHRPRKRSNAQWPRPNRFEDEGDRAQGRIRATYPLVFRVNPKSLGVPGLIPVIRAYGKSKHSQDTDSGPGGSGETICRKRIFASSQAIDPG